MSDFPLTDQNEYVKVYTIVQIEVYRTNWFLQNPAVGYIVQVSQFVYALYAAAKIGGDGVGDVSPAYFK
jgi:hypothetical protein